MRRTSFVLTLLTITALSLPAGARAGSYQHARQGWLIGFSLGGGSAQVTSQGLNSDREAGFAGSLRVGYAFNPEVSLELYGNSWVKEESGTTVSFNVGVVGLSYYPGASGFVVRGGVGAGSVSLSSSFGSSTTTTTESGLGFTFGAGYEFRVTRRFALGPQVDYGWTDQDGFNTNHINGTLGFSWYFVPR